jgi:AcrR family transcriptional regulator
MAGPRNTTRHREAGAASRAETRRRLLQAAGEEFAERGYRAATVTRIATRAGVTVQTLYLAWGSKRALLQAFLQASMAGDAERPYPERLAEMIAETVDQAGDDAAAIVQQIARLHCEVAERAALGWRLYRDAAGSDAEVAADWQTLQGLRRETFAGIVRRIPTASLRAGLDRNRAADTAWTIASPETYELLVRTAGYSPAEYRRWVTATLAAALLAP